MLGSKRVGFLCVLSAMVGLLFLSVVTADEAESDQETERFLRKARVVSIRKVISSTTYPMVLELQRKRQTRLAVFKYGLGERDFAAESADRPPRSFMDSYRHEVAAYRLDRALGLRMVPVAILREVRIHGAIIEWIPDAVSLSDLPTFGDEREKAEWLEEQQAKMRFFDVLIDNPNRRLSDQLVMTEEPRLRLIDHSCAFGESKQLPESYTSKRQAPPPELLARLAALREPPLRSLLGDLLGQGQIDALLARRLLLLEYTGAPQGE